MSTSPSEPPAQELERVLALPQALLKLDPGVEDRIVGCSAKEIAKLERLQGVALPPWYRAYLEKLGRTVGEVRYFQDIDLRPKSLLKWLGRNKWRSPRYVLIGLSEYGDLDAYIDLGEEGLGVEVVRFEYPGGAREPAQVLPLASRFSTYLLAALAVRVIDEMPAMGRLVARERPPGQLPALRRLLRRYGGEEHGLSGSWDKVYVGPRLVVVASEFGEREPLSLSLGCMAHDEWWEIAGRLEHELALEIVRAPG